MDIVMMGVQGSGKGTQAKLLSKHLELPHVSVGDIFRANIAQGTALGKKAQTYTDKGLLVPDEVVMDMMADRLKQSDVAKGLLLDGFPRNAVQMACLESLRPPEHVLFLDLDDVTAILRLSGRSECGKCQIIYGQNKTPKTQGVCDVCGGTLKERTDDRDTEAIQQRLQAFHESVKEILSYYAWKGVLRNVDAAQDVDAVFRVALAALGK